MPKRKTQEQGLEINWRAAEYQYVQKDVGWYWLLGIIALILLLLAFSQGNFFFAVFIVLAAIMLITLGRRRPRVFDFKINDKGVAIGDRIFYDYERFEGFTIRSRPERLDEIVLKKKTALNPYIRIPIDSELAPSAKSILEKKLPEIEYQESLIDIIFEWLGF